MGFTTPCPVPRAPCPPFVVATLHATLPLRRLLPPTGFSALYQDVNVRTTCSLIVGTVLAASQLDAQGAARLLGRVVRDDSVSVSLPDVEIRIDATDLVTRSDSQGGFRFDSVPSGRYVVSARRPGFGPFSSAQLFRPGETTELRIRLAAMPNELAEVRVEERQPLSIGMRGFEERRRAKIGKFIGPEEIERYTGPTLSGLIRRKIQGFDLVSLSTHGYMSGGFGIAAKRFQSIRSLSGRTQDQLCFAKIVVDGQRVTSGATGTPIDIDHLKPGEVVGMEFYRGASEVPTEFSGPDAACGVVVIWTRQRR